MKKLGLAEAIRIATRPAHVGSIEISDDYYDTHIDCAAIRMPDGRVWTGKRHCHCIATIRQATGERVTGEEQGFVTMSHRFVTREEGAALVIKTGQVTLHHPPLLYSEDLY